MERAAATPRLGFFAFRRALLECVTRHYPRHVDRRHWTENHAENKKYARNGRKAATAIANRTSPAKLSRKNEGKKPELSPRASTHLYRTYTRPAHVVCPCRLCPVPRRPSQTGLTQPCGAAACPCCCSSCSLTAVHGAACRVTLASVRTRKHASTASHTPCSSPLPPKSWRTADCPAARPPSPHVTPPPSFLPPMHR